MKIDDDTELEKKAMRVGKVVAIIILFIALAMIVTMVWKIVNLPEPEHREGTVPTYERIKIEQYCVRHKIRPEVILIESNGRMTYMLDGKRCEIK